MKLATAQKTRKAICFKFNVRVIRAAKPVCQRTTERGKALSPKYSINRDQPTSQASSLSDQCIVIVPLPLSLDLHFCWGDFNHSNNRFHGGFSESRIVCQSTTTNGVLNVT